MFLALGFVDCVGVGCRRCGGRGGGGGSRFGGWWWWLGSGGGGGGWAIHDVLCDFVERVPYCFVAMCRAGSCGGNTTPLLNTVDYPKVVWRAIVLRARQCRAVVVLSGCCPCSPPFPSLPPLRSLPPVTVARKPRGSDWPMPLLLQTLIVSVSRPLYRYVCVIVPGACA